MKTIKILNWIYFRIINLIKLPKIQNKKKLHKNLQKSKSFKFRFIKKKTIKYELQKMVLILLLFRIKFCKMKIMTIQKL